jgi:CHAT domain-containing protein
VGAALLLAPFDDLIEQDDLVVLVTEEELQLIPFAAVTMPDGKPLVQRAALVQAPSLTVLRELATRRRRRGRTGNQRILSLGIAFVEEARAVQRVIGGMGLTGNALRKEDIREHLEGTSIVHFACHGHFDPELPERSGLHLRAPESLRLEDVLSVRDLREWRLQAHLVTLGACETAKGKSAASEYMGLSRQLLVAGCDAVIGSLWAVRDRPTREFMLVLYGEMLRQAKAHSSIDIAEALRAAQLSLLSTQPMYNWAAFKLTGYPSMPARALRPRPTARRASPENRDMPVS